jgi:cation diffusion facilitator CzcD-associated flavoprotein CzcO
MIHKYFQDYATKFNLWQYINFDTRVERLYQHDESGVWIIETDNGTGREEFDYVCVGNGHYEDGWIPDIPGLSYVPLPSYIEIMA